MNTEKTVLVTGGAGFVGSHLCEQLVNEGYRVISLDNYFTGSKDNHVAGVEYRDGHTKDIATLVPETVDVIYHLGEYSRVAPSLEEPEVVWDLNVLGSLAVFEFWRQQKCKLVYAGSSTKFADDGRDVLGRDRAPYNFAKAVNSELVHNYGHWYDLPYSVAYFYNVYGPRERAGQFDGGYGTVIETFRQHALAGKPAVINGDGTQTRAFTHVSDTVSALMLIGEKGECDEYAISAKEAYSLNEVADMFNLEKTYAPATTSTRSAGAEDTTKLQTLGWQQRHILSDYIEHCIDKA
ncbi:NAD-dependent epimerase/dehydratase family protein [Candidatus Saccharibacteria bacterium]|nr:NAD-dependent epimerase/dehydratase family protein [Candidatus Saccharibacteria bacterium]